MRHGRTDTVQAAIVKALRRAGCLVAILSDVGDGVPDLLVFRAYPTHRWCLLEVKTSRAKTRRSVRMRAKQVEFAQAWPVSVVVNEDEALLAMGFRVLPKEPF